MASRFVDFLKFIRFPNLLVIVLVQYAIRHGVIAPILKLSGYTLQLPWPDFALLVFSTILMAAAAYIINDYFDQKTDSLNHPEEVLVGKNFSRRFALSLNWILNFISVIIGLYLSWKHRIPVLGAAWVLIPGLLFFYSNTYKRQFVWGNFIAAFLIALIPLIVVLYELPLLYRNYRASFPDPSFNFNPVFFWVAGYSVFIFGMILIYETLKDLRDTTGDQKYGIRTMPVVLGLFNTKILIGILSAGVIGAAVYIILNYIPDYLTIIYFSAFVLLPFVVFIVSIFRQKEGSNYRLAVFLAHWIMVAGLLYIGVAQYIITQRFGLPFPCF